jgi:hypothetical protein
VTKTIGGEVPSYLDELSLEGFHLGDEARDVIGSVLSLQEWHWSTCALFEDWVEAKNCVIDFQMSLVLCWLSALITFVCTEESSLAMVIDLRSLFSFLGRAF